MRKDNYEKGQEIHRKREEIFNFHERRSVATKESIEQADKEKLNIGLVATQLLEELGFEKEDRGTKYLSDIIETLYHERKVFDGENSFFDFNDDKNNHYSFTNEYYECGVSELKNRIQEAISKSFVYDKSINEIVYNVTNDLISQYDRTGKQLVLTK